MSSDIPFAILPITFAVAGAIKNTSALFARRGMVCLYGKPFFLFIERARRCATRMRARLRRRKAWISLKRHCFDALWGAFGRGYDERFLKGRNFRRLLRTAL